MEMRSFIVPHEQCQQAVQVMAITYMGNDLFKAAASGDMELFNKYRGDFQCLVDGRKNTALHIYLSTAADFVYNLKLKYATVLRYLFIFSSQKRCKKALNMNFVKQLVDKCPSLLLQPNEKGQIPLHIAAARVGISEVVKFIIECTKLVQNEDLEKGLEPTNWMKQMLRMRDEDGNTALHKAVESGEADVVKLLVKEFDPDDFSFSAKNKKGETPLYIAAREGNHLSVAEILEKCKSTAHGGPNGTTALHAAILGTRDEKTMKKLIEARKHLIKETSDRGRTPLHYAAHFGVRSGVKLMLEADASAAYITDTERGTTALHMAAWQGHKDIMEYIISYCPGCCEIVDKRYGWNFLHFAVVTLDAVTLLTFLFGAESKIKDLSCRNFLFEKDINGNIPLDVRSFMEDHPHNRGLINFVRNRRFVSFLQRGGFVTFLPSQKPKSDLNAEKKKQIGEILKEISNNAEVEGLPVHKFFREILECNPPNWTEITDKMRETHLLVVTLVATVTFASGIAVPGGYKSESSGTATLSHNSAFKAFIITDALAFASSLFAIFLHFLSVFFRATGLSFISILLAACLTVFAMVAMVVAFSTGTYAVLQSSPGVAIATFSIGLVLSPCSIIILLSFLYCIWHLL